LKQQFDWYADIIYGSGDQII